jgi:carbamoyl-phosphate synthase/aspartate carbamoyltransferase
VEDIDDELVNPTDKRVFAIASAFQVEYSVLVHPSYVLSGAAMNDVSTGDDLANDLT